MEFSAFGELSILCTFHHPGLCCPCTKLHQSSWHLHSSSLEGMFKGCWVYQQDRYDLGFVLCCIHRAGASYFRPVQPLVTDEHMHKCEQDREVWGTCFLGKFLHSEIASEAMFGPKCTPPVVSALKWNVLPERTASHGHFAHVSMLAPPQFCLAPKYRHKSFSILSLLLWLLEDSKTSKKGIIII